jgi:protein-S-isoprenylcysteine O-methyltransferase Ste14
MNDVLNSQGYTQAAWWNRIPVAAWALLLLIAVCSNVMVGYGARNAKAERGLLLVLPLIVAIAFFLIADIDSPRGGVIRVFPQNLHNLAESLRSP